MSLLFNMLSRLVIVFLPKSKSLLVSWLQSPSAVILEPQKIKSVTVPSVFSSICHEVKGPDAMIFIFWILSFKPTFSLSSFTFIKRLFRSSLLSAIRVVSSAYLRLLIFLLAILIPACATSSLAFCIMYSSIGKECVCSAGDQGLIPGSRRSPGEENGNPLQYSCLENPIDRGAWQTTVHGVARVEHDLVTKEREKDSARKFNKQGDNIRLWCTPFPIWNQSVVPWLVLLLPDLQTDFSGGRSGGLVFPSLEEFSTVCFDPHSQRLWHSQ